MPKNKTNLRVVDGLWQSDERFRLLVSSVKDYAIIMLDPGGRILTWNDGAERLKGYAEAEILGCSMECFYPSEALAAGKPAELLARAKEEGRVEDEGWRVRKDGSRFFADVIITALRDDGGELAGFAKVTRDITGRKAAEDALAESEARYRLIAENSTDVIMRIGPDSRRNYVSPAIRELTQYEPEELLDRPHGEIVHRDDRAVWAQSFKKSSELGVSQATYRIARKDGSYVWTDAIRRRLPDGGFVVCMRDITARVAAEDALREAKTRAEHDNTARITFFMELSHELRSPLNAVIGFASMMRRQMVGPIGNPLYLEYAADIEASAQHLLALINDILDHAKAEEGFLNLVETTVDLSQVMRFVLHTLAPRAAAAGVALTSTIRDDIAVVRGDERRLRQIFLNLGSNAVKFTTVGGRVSFAAKLDEDGSLLLTVDDTGVGIAEADQARIFEPFAQVQSAQSATAAEGTGLGLPLTRRLVELHGGSLAVNSAPGRGTTMTVRLPTERVRRT
ncbi:MAG: PAS domain S-box protein [Alphaproteobacteria bacterium]|nr:PAS domain S-box protein [Alphaproteobacteria bacterium]